MERSTSASIVAFIARPPILSGACDALAPTRTVPHVGSAVTILTTPSWRQGVLYAHEESERKGECRGGELIACGLRRVVAVGLPPPCSRP